MLLKITVFKWTKISLKDFNNSRKLKRWFVKRKGCQERFFPLLYLFSDSGYKTKSELNSVGIKLESSYTNRSTFRILRGESLACYKIHKISMNTSRISSNGRLYSYHCAFDIRVTFGIFLLLKPPKFLQVIVFKLLLHVRGFTIVTLKYWK